MKDILTQILRAVIAAIAIIGSVAAEEVPTMQHDEFYSNEFLDYRPYKTPAAKKKDAKPKPPAEAATPAAEKPGEQTVNVEWLQKNYPRIMVRAIDNPTPDNVSADQYTKRIILDKSQRYSNAVMEVVNQDPLLNENNRIPYASSGSQAVARANGLAQDQAVRELARNGGLLVFVDGTCRFCTMQMPIIAQLKRSYQMESLVISLDGAPPRGYDGPVVKDNGLWKRLNLKLTPSIVFVNRPAGYKGEDHNTYLIIAQGYYKVDELVKQIAYAGFRSKLLTDATMRDLDVWNTGIASTEDLNNLRLDANDPASFKRKLEPILLKQYGGNER